MAFYEKRRQKVNKKWYPIAVTVGKPVTTGHIADRQAVAPPYMSTPTPDGLELRISVDHL
ncbi:MAG: hypothetical protein LBF17_00690 [Mediterranea sp.]|jgi:hypothetical protein|nr:hypothetical protein [Mediterranea sp.]